MAYCNESHIDDVFNSQNIDQAIDDNADGTANSGLVTNLIDDASHEVWSYVKPHYSSLDPEDVTDPTSKTQVPVAVRNATAVLAAEMILTRQGKRVPERLATRIEYLRDKWLPGVAAGLFTVDATTTRTAKSTTDDVRRTMRDQGALSEYGETDPGDGESSDNDFFTENSGDN